MPDVSGMRPRFNISGLLPKCIEQRSAVFRRNIIAEAPGQQFPVPLVIENAVNNHVPYIEAVMAGLDVIIVVSRDIIYALKNCRNR